jgi:glutathione S-transferase
MIEVHHLNNSRSQRVLWLLEELGLPYEIKPYQRDAATNLAPEALKKIHPLGKSPVIRDGDTVVIESGAILEYLVRKHGEGRMAPAESSPDWPRYLQLMHYAEGSAMLPVMLQLYTSRLGEAAHRERARQPSRLPGRGALRPRLVRRRPDQRRRRPALVRDPGRAAAVRAGQVPEPGALPRPHPRAAGVPARARARRPVRLRKLSPFGVA